MNSVGIPEGTTIRSKRTCNCKWLMLTSDPPQFKLLQKCDNCKEKEGTKYSESAINRSKLC